MGDPGQPGSVVEALRLVDPHPVARQRDDEHRRPPGEKHQTDAAYQGAQRERCEKPTIQRVAEDAEARCVGPLQRVDLDGGGPSRGHHARDDYGVELEDIDPHLLVPSVGCL